MRYMRLFTLLFCLFLTGCQATLEQRERPLRDPAAHAFLARANEDLTAAIALDALWLVRDSATNNEAVSFTKLYEIATKFYASGNIAEGDRIAQKISVLANLAIAQAQENQDASPDYE